MEDQEAEWRRISGNAQTALDAGEKAGADLDALTLQLKERYESFLEGFREEILLRREAGRLLLDAYAELEKDGVGRADRLRVVNGAEPFLSRDEEWKLLQAAHDEEELTREVLERRLDRLFARRS